MNHDGHDHPSDHAHGPGDSRGALAIAAGANTVLLVVQVIGALAFGSLALLADSVHQASDVVSLILAVGIALLVARPSSNRYTFGFRRADALGGVLHAILLLAGAVLVILEAAERWNGEHEIDGVGVVVIAVAGLLVNGFSAKWLHGAHGHSLNVEGAVLHLVADALGSLAVLAGGVVVLITDEPRVDAVASFVVVALILWSAVTLARASLHVLMDGVPKGFDPAELRDSMLTDPMVVDAHHLHVRALDGATVSLTAHVQVDTEELHEAQVVVGRLTTMLAERGVAHVTLQAECHPCDGDDC